MSASSVVVIVGGGQAAAQSVASLRTEGFEGKIVLFGAEPTLPYQRPPLSKGYLLGTTPAERLAVRAASFYEQATVEVHTGVSVRGITLEPGNRFVRSSDGRVTLFDHLIFATGGRARPLPYPGADHPRLGYLRSVADVERLRPHFRAGAELGLIGGGYIGLEVAAAATTLGMKVTVFESAPSLLTRVAAPEVGNFFRYLHEAHGVRIQCSSQVTAIDGTPERPKLHLLDGSSHEFDFVLAGIGQIPNVELAMSLGLQCDNGIVVDDHCRTSVDGVYAIGDCSRQPSYHYGVSVRLESVPNALDHGKVVAATICGKSKPNRQLPWFWSDQYDVKLQTAGLNHGYDQIALRGRPESMSFVTFYLREGRLIAADAINRSAEFNLAKTWIANRLSIAPDRLADESIRAADLVSVATP